MNNIQASFTVRELVLLNEGLDHLISHTLDNIRVPFDQNDRKYIELMRLKDTLNLLTGIVPEAREA